MSHARALLLCGAVLGAVLAIHPPVSIAQSTGGLGVPVASTELGDGSVVVRVVNGIVSRPLSALEVSLVDEATGKELVVRTGPDGRAPFRGLKPGARYTAFTKVSDKELASQPLTIPEAGGVRVLLSPVPLRAAPDGSVGEQAEGGGAPHAGAGPAGMPDPRQMSGVARAEQNDRPGTLTVRTVQGTFRVDEIAGRVADHPKGAIVHLVSYIVGGKIEVLSIPVDDEGRAVFPRLQTDNSASYWVLSAFERGGTFDRLQSQSIELPPQVGLRLMLAGLAPDSTEPGVDDIPAIKNGEPPPDVGAVIVELAGQGDRISEVELLALPDSKVVATAKPSVETRTGPVQAQVGTAAPEPTLRDGLVQVRVVGPSGPLAGAVVSIATATSEGGAGAAIANKETDASGEVAFEGLARGAKIVVSLEARGASSASPAFEVPAKGGVRLGARVSWQNRPAATLAHFKDVAPGLYVARATNVDGTYWSPPFMMVADRGAITQMFVYPSLLFKFQGGAELDDTKMWFPLSIALWNPSLMPLDSGKDELLIPLPNGFVGAAVEDEMAARVRIDSDHGFVWKGVFPAGQRSFRASFALPVEDGNVVFEMPLPYGSFDSHLAFEDFPGVTLDVPTSANREPMKMPDGKDFIVLRQINIKPGQSLSLSVRGLPQKPAWKRFLPLIAGLGVLGLLIWGFASIFILRKRAAVPIGVGEVDLAGQREALLSQLVVIDEKLAKQLLAAGAGKKPSDKKKSPQQKKLHDQRAAIVAKLEVIYNALDGSPTLR